MPPTINDSGGHSLHLVLRLRKCHCRVNFVWVRCTQHVFWYSGWNLSTMGVQVLMIKLCDYDTNALFELIIYDGKWMIHSSSLGYNYALCGPWPCDGLLRGAVWSLYTWEFIMPLVMRKVLDFSGLTLTWTSKHNTSCLWLSWCELWIDECCKIWLLPIN